MARFVPAREETGVRLGRPAMAVLSKSGPHIVLALLLCVLVRSAAWAMPWQSAPAGQAQFTVMDQNGLPLGQVIVIALQNNKVVAQERTSLTGNAVLRQLAPGTYKLMVEKNGFYTTVVASLVIVAGQTSPV